MNLPLYDRIFAHRNTTCVSPLYPKFAEITPEPETPANPVNPDNNKTDGDKTNTDNTKTCKIITKLFPC